jgi:hypothetical protein
VALIYKAQLSPTKIELLTAWLPTQPWWTGEATGITAIGAYRFDDPAGEVGIETHLLMTTDGRVVQVPATYRSAPLADTALIGTTQHSVLGRRWVYDGCADPVYVAALATAILTGGRQAEMQVVVADGRLERRELTTFVTGSGRPGADVPRLGTPVVTSEPAGTSITSDRLKLHVRRLIDGVPTTGDAFTLTGRWPGNVTPTVLAWAEPLG